MTKLSKPISYLSSNSRKNLRKNNASTGMSVGSKSSIVSHKDSEYFTANNDSFIKILFKTIFRDKFIIRSLLFIVVWSSVCAYSMSLLIYDAQKNPNGKSSEWIEWIEMGNNPLRVVGSLFSFSLVFRFKVCYDRWWEGRQSWGQIITGCLDISMQANRWIADQHIVDCFNRFLIIFSYACKCLLQQSSLSDSGDGNKLMSRYVMTLDELVEFQQHPSWEPYFCLEMLRELLQSAYLVEDGFYLQKNKVHSQVYRCFDNSIKDLNYSIGQCIAVQAADLPLAYDGIHLFSLYLYFIFAPVIWATMSMWIVVPLSLVVGLISLSLIVLGTQLVDPFGTHEVDIPMESFCKIIEEQIDAISERRERESFKRLISVGKKKPLFFSSIEEQIEAFIDPAEREKFRDLIVVESAVES